MTPFRAAMVGSKEIGFTVLSMSTSLIAVFIPILLMGGIVGRLFREFAVTLSVAILVSLVVSLTTTPMLSAKFLESHGKRQHGWFYRLGERALKWLAAGVRARAAVGARTSEAGADDYGADVCAECLSLHPGAEGILSGAGHGTHRRTDSRAAGCFVSGDEEEGAGAGGDRSQGSRCSERDGVCRRAG